MHRVCPCEPWLKYGEMRINYPGRRDIRQKWTRTRGRTNRIEGGACVCAACLEISMACSGLLQQTGTFYFPQQTLAQHQHRYGLTRHMAVAGGRLEVEAYCT